MRGFATGGGVVGSVYVCVESSGTARSGKTEFRGVKGTKFTHALTMVLEDMSTS